MSVMIGLVWAIFPLIGMVVMALVVGSVLMAGMVWRRSRGMSCGSKMTRLDHREQRGPTGAASADPLDIARERYAQGLISHEEFDALVERLVKTDRHA